MINFAVCQEIQKQKIVAKENLWNVIQSYEPKLISCVSFYIYMYYFTM